MFAEAGITGDKLAEEPSHPLGCSGKSGLQYYPTLRDKAA
jgi:hypothetical protein